MPLDQLRELNAALGAVPGRVHRASEAGAPARATGDRARRVEEAAVDWGHAELLAFASLLRDGTPIRLTGQDTARGTFSQRHAGLWDAEHRRACTCRSSTCPASRASFELHNSPLSEYACLGFEYGYAVTAPEALVLWEAQYGDFVNGAEIIIDQFLVSGPREVAADVAPDAAAAARLRGLGPGALVGAARALPGPRRRGQHPRHLPDDARRSTSTSCAARRSTPMRGRW